MSEKLITVFTPTYNRAHTLVRTYESLCRQTCDDFEWLIIDDGSTDNTEEVVKGWLQEKKIPIRYIKKENGGLHTGYNEALKNIDTELCVCIDSDDYMPDNAIEIINRIWSDKGAGNFAGIIGLDYIAKSNTPVGGRFSKIEKPVHFLDIRYKMNHHGDTKMVLRTDLIKPFVPMPSFPGEKNFNPIYFYFKINPKIPYILVNENLCFVDYQNDGMSVNIYNQFVNSPRSFAELRKLAISHPKIPFSRKLIESMYLSSSAAIAKDYKVLKGHYNKLFLFFGIPFGIIFALYCKIKATK